MLREEDDPTFVQMDMLESAKLANDLEKLGYISIAAAIDEAHNSFVDNGVEGAQVTLWIVKDYDAAH